MIATATPTQIALHEARKARMARMARMASRVKANDNAAVRIAAKETDIPEWSIKATRFDAHVTDFRLAKVCELGTKKSFMAERAKAYGFTVEQIVERKRNVALVNARQIIMLEMKEKWGDAISLPEIARMFGGMHHTSVLHAIDRARSYRDGTVEMRTPPKKRIRTKDGKPYKPGPAANRTPDDVRQQVVAMHRAGGYFKSEIARRFGITRHTVRNILIESGDMHVGRR